MDEAHRLVAHIGAQVCARDRGSDKARTSQIGCNPRLREIGAVEPGAKHLRGEQACALQTCACEVRFEQPCLIEDGAIELRTDKPRLVEPGRAKVSAGQVKPGQVEARQPLSGEIGGRL
jgi:hypothetical protein